MKRLLLFFSFAIAAFGQQNAVMLPWTPQQFTNTNGTILVSGKVCTYLAGTSTGTATFTDASAGVSNAVPPNAILLDSTGRPTSGGIWLTPNKAYKIVTLTAGSDNTCNTGVTIKTQDNVAVGVAATTNNTFTGTNSFTGTVTAANFNNILWVDGVKYTTLASAMAACPLTTCIINDTIPETFSANPFASLPPSTSVAVHLGRGTWVTNAAIIVSNKSQLTGEGRGDPNSNGTVIQAGGSFPASTSVLQMGPSPGPNNAVRIENLTVDCHNVSGAIGVTNSFAQEQSSLNHLLITNCPNISLNITTAGAQNSGPYTDLEILDQASCTNCVVGTIPVLINLGVSNFRGIRGMTVNSNGATSPTIGIRIDSAGMYSDIHTEEVTSSIVIGSVGATSNVIVSDVGCGPNITDCVKISNAFSSQNITLLGILATTGNIITDQILGNTITQAGEGSTVAAYVLGNGSPPGLYTSSANFGNQLNNWTFYKERAAPTGAANYDTVYADSTAHALKVSLNNGAFGPLVTAAPCTTSQKTESAADTNLLTCAIPAQAGSYRVRFVLYLSAANAATIGWAATWHDSNGGAEAPPNLPLFNDSIGGVGGNSATPALSFTTSSISSYHGSVDLDVDNSGTSIVVKLTFSGTSFTGKASATVERII